MRAAGVLVQELVQIVGVDAELPAKHVGSGGGGSQWDQALATLTEHVGQCPHRGRLAGPGRPEPRARFTSPPATCRVR
jgi:hypothetical protein